MLLEVFSDCRNVLFPVMASECVHIADEVTQRMLAVFRSFFSYPPHQLQKEWLETVTFVAEKTWTFDRR